ncbi:sodium:proton antiporter [Methyloraptor flagellatus]|uniref:Sodium:proton antiporter n=1 Tax=Methyloraptor flagellatus TaxID=3162530 RepID=A0AAU7X7E9_9HYPH
MFHRIDQAAIGRAGVAALVVFVAVTPAAAAGDAEIAGRSLGVVWALPFVGILLSIALMPLIAPHFWHHHYGKVALGWALAFAVPFAVVQGGTPAAHALAHTALLEYIPFVALLGSLFTIAGGILIKGNLHGSPKTNLAILGGGTLLASVIGTTGASMVLIRPLIRANDERIHNVHVVVFFIFLVSNVGGSLTPLGDPPLFLGYLKGVGFFWTTVHMLAETIFVAVILLAVFHVLDRRYYAMDHRFRGFYDPTPDSRRIRLEGKINILLLAVVVAAVLMSGSWKPGIEYVVYGTPLQLQDLLRDVILIVAAGLSLVLTPRDTRAANGFTWGPIVEVAKLFAGIFVTIIPVIAMLKAGRDGPFGGLVALVSHADGTPNNAMYFWLTGILSSFLDNAPTYLVFFNLAGGDPVELMGPLASTLLAISCGAVFMGANTYIGNAPNFMVKAIAEERGVHMPSFFGYMVWSGAVLIPTFVLVTAVFFRP